LNLQNQSRPRVLKDADEEIILICYPFMVTPTNPRSIEFLEFKQDIYAALFYLRPLHNLFRTAASMAMSPVCFANPQALRDIEAAVDCLVSKLTRARTHISIAKALSLWEEHLNGDGLQRAAKNLDSTLMFHPGCIQRFDTQAITPETSCALDCHTDQLISILHPLDFFLRILPNSIASGLCNAKYLQDTLPHIRSIFKGWADLHNAEEMNDIFQWWMWEIKDFIQEAIQFELANTCEIG
jgi:hypothetical protein